MKKKKKLIRNWFISGFGIQQEKRVDCEIQWGSTWPTGVVQRENWWQALSGSPHECTAASSLGPTPAGHSGAPSAVRAHRGWHGTPTKHMAIQCFPLVTSIAAWAFAQINSLNTAFELPPSTSSTSIFQERPLLSVYMRQNKTHCAFSFSHFTRAREIQTSHTAEFPAGISLFQGNLLFRVLLLQPSLRESQWSSQY